MSESFRIFDYPDLKSGAALPPLDQLVLTIPITQVNFVAGSTKICFFNPDFSHRDVIYKVGLKKHDFSEGKPGDAGKLRYIFFPDGTIERQIHDQSNLSTGVLPDMAVRRLRLIENLGRHFSLGPLTSQAAFQSYSHLSYRPS